MGDIEIALTLVSQAHMRETLNEMSLWVKVIKKVQLLSVVQMTEMELLSLNKKSSFSTNAEQYLHDDARELV